MTTINQSMTPHVIPTVTRTTTACIHFAVWAELDTVHRTMVTFQNLPFFTVHAMHSNPFIPQVSRDKTVLQDWMDRGRGW